MRAFGALQRSAFAVSARAKDGGQTNPSMSPARVFDPCSSFTSRIRLPTILGRAPPSFALRREPQVRAKATGGLPAGRLYDAEEHRTCGRARSALRPQTSSRLSERSERSSRSEFATRSQGRAPQGTPPEGWGVACEALPVTRSRPRADARTGEQLKVGRTSQPASRLIFDRWQTGMKPNFTSPRTPAAAWPAPRTTGPGAPAWAVPGHPGSAAT